MRISDWSSDVCSSDLAIVRQRQRRAADDRRAGRDLERRGGGAVVAMGVGAEDRGDALALDRAQYRVDMASPVGVGRVADTHARSKILSAHVSTTVPNTHLVCPPPLKQNKIHKIHTVQTT